MAFGNDGLSYPLQPQDRHNGRNQVPVSAIPPPPPRLLLEEEGGSKAKKKVCVQPQISGPFNKFHFLPEQKISDVGGGGRPGLASAPNPPPPGVLKQPPRPPNETRFRELPPIDSPKRTPAQKCSLKRAVHAKRDPQILSRRHHNAQAFC